MKKQVSIISDFDNAIMEHKSCYSFLNFASLTSFYTSDYQEQMHYFCDGILMAKLVGVLSGKKITRVSFDFTSIADQVFKYIETNNKSLYVIGANRHEVSIFCQKIINQYPDVNLAGYRDGYFSKQEYDDVIEQVGLLNPDYVLLGLGAGKQEQFGCILREKCKSTSVFTCGGFIRQESSSKKNYYPKLIDKLNLRAFYRMYKEPHTIRRYLLDYPKNAIAFIYYHLNGTLEIDVKK